MGSMRWMHHFYHLNPSRKEMVSFCAMITQPAPICYAKHYAELSSQQILNTDKRIGDLAIHKQLRNRPHVITQSIFAVPAPAVVACNNTSASASAAPMASSALPETDQLQHTDQHTQPAGEPQHQHMQQQQQQQRQQPPPPPSMGSGSGTGQVVAQAPPSVPMAKVKGEGIAATNTNKENAEDLANCLNNLKI